MNSLGSPGKRYSAWNDRRVGPRVPSQGLAQMTVLQTPNPTVLTATVIDVSRYGLQLEVDIPVQIASNVEISLKETIVMGLVGNCGRRPNGRFRIGVITGNLIEPARRQAV
jgi:hypothetical protein